MSRAPNSPIHTARLAAVEAANPALRRCTARVCRLAGVGTRRGPEQPCGAKLPAGCWAEARRRRRAPCATLRRHSRRAAAVGGGAANEGRKEMCPRTSLSSRATEEGRRHSVLITCANVNAESPGCALSPHWVKLVKSIVGVCPPSRFSSKSRCGRSRRKNLCAVPSVVVMSVV